MSSSGTPRKRKASIGYETDVPFSTANYRSAVMLYVNGEKHEVEEPFLGIHVPDLRDERPHQQRAGRDGKVLAPHIACQTVRLHLEKYGDRVSDNKKPSSTLKRA